MKPGSSRARRRCRLGRPETSFGSATGRAWTATAAAALVAALVPGYADACSCARESLAGQVWANPLTLLATVRPGAHGAGRTSFDVLGVLRGKAPDSGPLVLAHRRSGAACGLTFTPGELYLFVFAHQQMARRPWRTNACRAVRIGPPASSRASEPYTPPPTEEPP